MKKHLLVPFTEDFSWRDCHVTSCGVRGTKKPWLKWDNWTRECIKLFQ